MRIKNMTNTFKAICLTIVSLAMFACASEKGTYVNADKSGVISKEINLQDWNNAASSLVNELLASGTLDKIEGQKPLRMLVSKVKSNVDVPIDRDLITKQICIALNNSGKAQAVSNDTATIELAQKQAQKAGKTLPLPNITLTGSISQIKAKTDDASQVDYIFYIEVNYLGNSVWMGQKQISKQFTKSTFGW